LDLLLFYFIRKIGLYNGKIQVLRIPKVKIFLSNQNLVIVLLDIVSIKMQYPIT